eukprot:gnl/TRDRNA2_/TRDRNA2_175047_c0_seq1.p1 gnl/TRDRNA2_/TRDRNA2_175047_c0~~gnl/TRDRNA2_/TRDRNA2_175047_c0_seq1.p1  ORF type:complete len:418 (+),score=105.02 gnl/TRDRNA2_/TRDRNA2_175047_c0_seq1:24-1256(+)
MSDAVESLNVAVATGILLHTMAVEEHKSDAAKAKQRRKGVHALKQQVDSAQPVAQKGADSTVGEERELDAAEARKRRKAIKQAAAVVAEDEQEFDVALDPAAAKKLRKAAKHTATAGAEKEQQLDAAEKKQTKTAEQANVAADGKHGLRATEIGRGREATRQAASASAAEGREQCPETTEAKKRKATSKRAVAGSEEEPELDEAKKKDNQEQEHDMAQSKKQRKSIKRALEKISAQELIKKPQTTNALDIFAAASSSLAHGCSGEDRMLILEEVHDSFNLGAILHSAEAFGIEEVLCIMHNAAARSYIRSSIGAMFRVKISTVESAAAAISHCRSRGMRIVATTPHCTEELTASDFRAPCAVAMGNEADGLSRELLAGADSHVRIEMFGTMESLNIAVATGIVLHAMATT